MIILHFNYNAAMLSACDINSLCVTLRNVEKNYSQSEMRNLGLTFPQMVCFTRDFVSFDLRALCKYLQYLCPRFEIFEFEFKSQLIFEIR